jgi:hypothetical protein
MRFAAWLPLLVNAILRKHNQERKKASRFTRGGGCQYTVLVVVVSHSLAADLKQQTSMSERATDEDCVWSNQLFHEVN